MLHASIDVGTNTVRLLIAETEGPAIKPLVLRRSITRLGGGFSAAGISAEAADRTVQALGEFAAELRRQPVDRLRAVATSAVRDASNGAAFCTRVLEETGIGLEVIGGEEEAVLTLKGALAGVGASGGDFLVFDIGGGSTEFTLSRGEEVLFARSLPLGVVRLTEGKAEVAGMVEKVRRELAVLPGALSAAGRSIPPGATLIGTAGTVTTLAAVDMAMTDYDYRKVNGHRLGYDDVRTIYDRLLPLSAPQRLQVPGLEKGREDLIIAGIIVVLATMELFGFRHLTVSDFGLLEGVLVDLVQGSGR
ncbi:MAG TPA: Ppx/GppA phosphatase family protein [Verrucomicrobiae bacterium]|nr:Ppx/GppA phosphatase family protein [Verrucomicrobiae bacterium]